MTREQVLDHGYVELVEGWGSDERIIEAARMSTGKGFQGWGLLLCQYCDAIGETGELPRTHCRGGRGGAHVRRDDSFAGDEKLLRYLWENKHHTPFEMAGFTIEVQAPIFVFREWHRHRVPFSYNEMSARYTPLPDLAYIPTVERLMLGSDGKNKQAGTVSGAAVLTVEEAERFRVSLKHAYYDAEDLYRYALEAGIPKELARVHLPVGRYSRMRASSNLRGWLNFLALRAHPAAQWEIRQYAEAVGRIVAERHPRTWALFQERA